MTFDDFSLLLRETDRGNLDQDSFKRYCEDVGADTGRGLTNEELKWLCARMPLKKIEADLLVMQIGADLLLLSAGPSGPPSSGGRRTGGERDSNSGTVKKAV